MPNRSTKKASLKKKDYLLPHNTLVRIYRQEGIRFRSSEERKVQEEFSKWLLKTAWISSLYATHVGHKAVSQQDIGRSLLIQGITTQSELRKYRQTGGYADSCPSLLSPNKNIGENCHTSDGDTRLTQPGGSGTDNSKEPYPIGEPTPTCFGGGRKNKTQTKRRMSRNSKKNNRRQQQGGNTIELDGAINHVQYKQADPKSSGPTCAHDTDHHTYNTIDGTRYPLHKFDKLYDPLQVGGQKSQQGGLSFTRIHQVTIPRKAIERHIRTLPVSRWSDSATELLHHASEYRLRQIIEEVRNKT